MEWSLRSRRGRDWPRLKAKRCSEVFGSRDGTVREWHRTLESASATSFSGFCRNIPEEVSDEISRTPTNLPRERFSHSRFLLAWQRLRLPHHPRPKRSSSRIARWPESRARVEATDPKRDLRVRELGLRLDEKGCQGPLSWMGSEGLHPQSLGFRCPTPALERKLA